MANSLRYFVGNWKMFGTPRSIKILKKINSYVSNDKKKNKYRIIFTPPYTLLETFSKFFKKKYISIGSQNCYQKRRRTAVKHVYAVNNRSACCSQLKLDAKR